MKRAGRLAASIVAVVSASFVGLITTGVAVADAHPLHTSLGEVVFDPASNMLRLSIRVFVDDYFKASRALLRSHPPPAGSTASELLTYARASFLVAGRDGKPIPLSSCGAKRVGDLMWLCFTVPAPNGPAGFEVADNILFDLYADQINIVQATLGSKKVNLLYTRGDGFKKLE